MESPTERAIYTVRYAIATMPIIQRGYDFEQASYMNVIRIHVLIHEQVMFFLVQRTCLSGLLTC